MWIERTAELRAITRALALAKLVALEGPLGVGKSALATRIPWSRPRRDLSLAVATKAEARRALATALRLARDDPKTLARALASREGELLVVDDAENVSALAPELLDARTTGANVLLLTRVPLPVPRTAYLRPIHDARARALLEGVCDADAAALLVARAEGLPLALAIARGFLGEIDAHAVLRVFDRDLERPNDGESLAKLCARALARLPSRDAGHLRALAVFPASFTVRQATAAFALSEHAGLATCHRLLGLGLLTSNVRHGLARLSLSAPLASVLEPRKASGAVCAAILDDGEEELARALTAPSDETWSRLALEEPSLVLVTVEGKRATDRERAATLVHRLRSTLGPLRVPAPVASVKPTRAPLALARGELARLAGDHDAARRAFASALALAPRHGALEAEARRRLAQLARIEGRWATAAAELERATAAYRELGDRPGEAQCVAEEAFALAARGLFDEAADRKRVALALLEREGTAADRAIARSYLAVHLHRAGRLREAEAMHRSALAEHEALGAARYSAAAHMHLGYVAHELGRDEDAVVSLERSRAAQRALGDAGLEALSCVYLARVMADARRVSDGEQLIAEASVLLREITAPAHHAAAELVRGHLAMDRSAFRVAADAYAVALRLVRSPTVGFEALTGAYLAAALHAACERGAKVRRALRASERMLGAVRHPFLTHAFAVLSAFVRGEPLKSPPKATIDASSEVRRALRRRPEVDQPEVLRSAQRRWRDGPLE
ncbi:hypothetical protein BH09MYX1_BH09MYX1_34340 [soil metagenome]